MRVVRDALAFGHFEHDAFGRKTVLGRGFERRAYARLRTVDGVRQEVDAEHAFELQPRGEVDRLHPARLVEAVAVIVVNLAEDRARALAFEPAHQRFVAEYRARGDVDDGLESHRKFDLQRPCLPAVAAADRDET